jgi:hypothetical protein
MAYNPAVAQARNLVQGGLYDGLGGAAADGGNIFSYCSSHSAADIGGVAGFFTGCGANPSSNPGQGSLARSTNNVGMRKGDVLINIESSAGVQPGRTTLHSVIGSTFNQASTSASSAFAAGAGFNVTVSTAPSS